MCRPGHTTLPNVHLLSFCLRRTLKAKSFDGRPSCRYLSVLPSLTVFRVDISPKHKISQNTQKILNDRSHVLYLPTLYRAQAILDGTYDESQEGLRMVFVTNTMQKKRVVRSWARRRIDQAVTEALRTRGFDRNGRRLVDPYACKSRGSDPQNSPNNITAKSAPKALIGTVNILVLSQSIETSFTEVQRQAGVVADNILKTCGHYRLRRGLYNDSTMRGQNYMVHSSLNNYHGKNDGPVTVMPGNPVRHF